TFVPASSCSTWMVGSLFAVISRPYSHMGDIGGDVVEGGVAIDLVAAGGEHRVLLVRARGRDVRCADDPDAHAFVSSGVDIAGVVDGHLVIGGVQRSDVDVVESALAAHEDLVERPFAAGRAGIVLRRGGAGVGLGHFAASSAVVDSLAAGVVPAASAVWFSAKASAASRTHAPSSHARLRWARRWALQGPSPLTTAQNSSQFGVEKS